MECSINEDGRFSYSGEQSRLEYYKCFHDPSNPEWITGEELLRLEKTTRWEEKHSKIWYYFYRPYNYGKNIGCHQKESITRINSHSSHLLNKSKLNKLFVFILTFICISFYFLSISLILIAIPISIITLLLFQNSSINDRLIYNSKSIKILECEVDYLLKQQKSILSSMSSPNEMDRIFWYKIKQLEEKYIDKAIHESYETVRRNTPNFYKNIDLSFTDEESFPVFPVIPSWALLQPSYKYTNNGGTQRTGVKVAADRIGNKIATWRNIDSNRAIYRLWYIQHLFFHEKNLSIMSYYYDFISNEIYSEHIESYQYNHITNYSYIDEDISNMNEDPLISEIRLPKNLTKNIFGNQVKTISLESASGAYHKSVIPDDDVTRGLNIWIEYNRSQEKIIENNLNDDDIFLIDEREELFKIQDNYKGLIETLAWLSFKELREKVAIFSLTETSK